MLYFPYKEIFFAKEMKPMNFDIAGLFDTLLKTLTDMGLPMDTIMNTLQPVIDTVMKVLEPILGGLIGG